MKTDNQDQLAFPFHIFAAEQLNPLSGQTMTATETCIAQLLMEATSAQPIKIADIIVQVAEIVGERLNERQIKIIVRSFRRDRAFPILSRRATPAGYWWCQSLEEMKEFALLWQSQYFDEMRTLWVMMKHHYPRLAGQMRLPNLDPPDSQRR